MCHVWSSFDFPRFSGQPLPLLSYSVRSVKTLCFLIYSIFTKALEVTGLSSKQPDLLSGYCLSTSLISPTGPSPIKISRVWILGIYQRHIQHSNRSILSRELSLVCALFLQYLYPWAGDSCVRSFIRTPCDPTNMQIIRTCAFNNLCINFSKFYACMKG